MIIRKSSIWQRRDRINTEADLSFESAKQQSITFKTDDRLNFGTNPFGLSFFLELNGNTNSEVVALFPLGTVGTNRLIILTFGTGDTRGLTILITVGVDTVQVSNNSLFDKNDKVHVVVQKTATDLELYINNKLEESSPLGAIAADPIDFTGSVCNLMGAPGLIFTDGKLSNFTVFNNSLTNSEIEFIHQNGGVVPISAHPNCVLHYPLTQRSYYESNAKLLAFDTADQYNYAKPVKIPLLHAELQNFIATDVTVPGKTSIKGFHNKFALTVDGLELDGAVDKIAQSGPYNTDGLTNPINYGAEDGWIYLKGQSLNTVNSNMFNSLRASTTESWGLTINLLVDQIQLDFFPNIGSNSNRFLLSGFLDKIPDKGINSFMFPFVHDNTTGTYTIYVNGVAFNWNPVTPRDHSAFDLVLKNFKFGAFNAANSVPNKGYIAELRFYDNTITPQEAKLISQEEVLIPSKLKEQVRFTRFGEITTLQNNVIKLGTGYTDIENSYVDAPSGLLPVVKALQLDDAKDQWLEPVDPFLVPYNDLGQYTVQIFFKPYKDVWGAPADDDFLLYFADNLSESRFSVQLVNDSIIVDIGTRVGAGQAVNGSITFSTADGFTMPINQISVLTILFDNSNTGFRGRFTPAAENYVQCYLNGYYLPITQKNLVQNDLKLKWDEFGLVRSAFGHNKTRNVTVPGFEGALMDVKVWTKALSDKEILENANNTFLKQPDINQQEDLQFNLNFQTPVLSGTDVIFTDQARGQKWKTVGYADLAEVQGSLTDIDPLRIPVIAPVVAIFLKINAADTTLINTVDKTLITGVPIPPVNDEPLTIDGVEEFSIDGTEELIIN